MVWPDDRTQTLQLLSAIVWRETIQAFTDLVTEGDNELLATAMARGAVQPHQGGDYFDVNVMYESGTTELTFDPSAVNHTTSITITGYQYLAPAKYGYEGRSKNVSWAQSLPRMANNPRKLANELSVQYLANSRKMLENYQNAAASPGGFFQPVSKLPTAGNLTNAYTMFGTQDVDFAEVDVSTYTHFKPTLTNAESTNGSNLVKKDIQNFIDACNRGAEGGVTDIFTTQNVFEKIRAQAVTDGVHGLTDIQANLGWNQTYNWNGVIIHWSRHLSTNTAWDITAATATTEPFIGIDFNTVRFRHQTGNGIDGDMFSLIERMSAPALDSQLLMWWSRLQSIAQWGFIGNMGSRRTSGIMEGLEAITF